MAGSHAAQNGVLNAYLDGELDPINSLAQEMRIAREPQFATQFTRLDALQRMIRAALQRGGPQAGLRASI
jgi:anti-sigma factor RsiW